MRWGSAALIVSAVNRYKNKSGYSSITPNIILWWDKPLLLLLCWKSTTPVDTCAVLTGSIDPTAYWRKLKQRLKMDDYYVFFVIQRVSTGSLGGTLG